MDNQKQLTVDKLLEFCDQIPNNDSLEMLYTFNDEMTISQVVRFFEKQQKQFTKTMIQNYVRIGIVPPPIEKRYYTKKHLILLALIDQLKEVYSLDDIKTVFSPILKDATTFDDDLIDIAQIYENFILLKKLSIENWRKHLPDSLYHANEQVEKDKITGNDKSKASAFLLVLTLMTQSVATKNLIELISNEYLAN